VLNNAYFETADAYPHRRLLLVSYHFPPDAAIGARRWEKLAHYAAERGWGLDVLTHRDPRKALTDVERARLCRLPAGVRVYAIPSSPLVSERLEHWALRMRQRAQRFTSASDANQRRTSTSAGISATTEAAPSSIAREAIRWQLQSPRGWMRMYWAWLEFAKIEAWARDVARFAEAIVQPDVHEAVVTSGPPHMSHDAGRRISERTGLPFVMDMRDPWRHVERLSEATASPLWLQLADRHEARAVNRAALVVANTELSCQALQRSYPSRRDDIITAMNGVDDDPLPAPRRGKRFVIAHAGTVYLDRDPRALFQAAGRVVRGLALTPDDFGLEFIGEMEAVGGFPILEVAAQEGLVQYVRTGPPRPHPEAMQFMADATMLVTMSGTNRTAIPAKTFECMRFDAWLLALSAPGSATELLLRGTEADVVAPKDVDGIEAVLRHRYAQHVAGEQPIRIAADARFSRATQARILFDAIEDRV